MAENARQSEYMSGGMREHQNGCQRECQIISYFRVFSALEVSSNFQAQLDVCVDQFTMAMVSTTSLSPKGGRSQTHPQMSMDEDSASPMKPGNFGLGLERS